MQQDDVVYAGFWIRLAATLIDTVLVALVTFPLLWWIYGARYFDGSQSGTFAGPADFLISWVMPSLAVILFWRHRQATPGKILLSLRVVDAATGAPIAAAGVRTFVEHEAHRSSHTDAAGVACIGPYGEGQKIEVHARAGG